MQQMAPMQPMQQAAQLPQLTEAQRQANLAAQQAAIRAAQQAAQQAAQKAAQQVVKPAEHMTNQNVISYETFQGVDGVSDSVHNAAPFKKATEVNDINYATVKFSGKENDDTDYNVIQIEGTDLLTAPLVDNMLYTNSIANTNRNASNDLRGDVPLQFNESYTPFYSSVIYGAPLSEKSMTIGKL
jgi:type II secretory pathway pseudopilin PulG